MRSRRGRGKLASSLTSVVAAVAAFAAGPARADRQELYTIVSYDPGVSRYRLPVDGSGPDVTRFANSLALTVYYGISNRLHLGSRLRASRASDVRFSGTSVRMNDGSQSQGEVFLDHWSLGVGALVVYRIDTRSAFAPLLELEGGVTTHRYGRIAHIPAGVTYTVPQADVSSSTAYGAVAVLLEYRFANRWVAAGGVSTQLEAGGFAPWTVSLPLRIGYIW